MNVVLSLYSNVRVSHVNVNVNTQEPIYYVLRSLCAVAGHSWNMSSEGKLHFHLACSQELGAPCARCFNSVEPPTGCQFRMGSFNTNKILGVVPKREFSEPK